MRYWEEMQTKRGFNEGCSIPPDAEACRTVYIKIINALAEKYGSCIRVAKYNRPGFHNHCLTLFHNIDQQPDVDNEPVADDAMCKAIAEAFEMNLDDFVSVVVSIDENKIEELINSI